MTREKLQQHLRNALHTIAILVKDTERLLEFRYLLLSQLLHHVFLSPALKIHPPARVRLQAKEQSTGCQACKAHKRRAQQQREEGAKWPLSRFSKDWWRKSAPKKKRRKEETNPVHMRPICSPNPDCRVALLLLAAATTATMLPIKPAHFILLPKTKKVSESKNIIVAIDKILLV